MTGPSIALAGTRRWQDCAHAGVVARQLLAPELGWRDHVLVHRDTPGVERAFASAWRYSGGRCRVGDPTALLAQPGGPELLVAFVSHSRDEAADAVRAADAAGWPPVLVHHYVGQYPWPLPPGDVE